VNLVGKKKRCGQRTALGLLVMKHGRRMWMEQWRLQLVKATTHQHSGLSYQVVRQRANASVMRLVKRGEEEVELLRI
jgi:hypothetical protein